MTARVLPDNPAARSEAAAVLERGGIVAIPTDTVYGIAADLRLPDAIERLFAAKDRPPEKAVAVLVADPVQANLLGTLDERAERLAERFWPGGLTLVLRARPGAELPRILAGGATIAVRVPDHPCPRALAEAIGPLPTTSANLSGRAEAQTAQEILQLLGDRVDLIIDGGPAPGGPPSTVVDMTSDPPAVLREGPISAALVEAALVDVPRDEQVVPRRPEGDGPGVGR